MNDIDLGVLYIYAKLASTNLGPNTVFVYVKGDRAYGYLWKARASSTIYREIRGGTGGVKEYGGGNEK